MNIQNHNLCTLSLALTLSSTLAACGGSSDDDLGAGADDAMGSDTEAPAGDDDGPAPGDDDGPAPGDGDDDGPAPGDDTGEPSDDTGEPSDDTGMEPVEAFCGDGNVDDGEICDDGSNEGAREGDCNPTCSAVVALKHVTMSETATDGAFGDGTVPPVTYADAQCPAGYKAMFAHGSDRVASESPYQGDGQVDWVIAPWTEYVNDNGGTVFVTGDIALLGVDASGAWVGLDYAIDDEVTAAWTGMANDYTTHAMTCSDWTDGDPNAYLSQGSDGVPSVTDDDFVGTALQFGRGFCFSVSPFYCVEQ